MSIQKLTNHLTLDERGIYQGKNCSRVSYPNSGNTDCFLVEDSSFWFSHRNKCITSMIRDFPPTGPIIDVGGGNGYVTRGILDAGFQAILLEPGAEGALNGKNSRQIPTVICSTLQGARFKDSSLSAIGCFDVIEHIESDQEFIRQVHEVLKPGGLLYVTVPAHEWLWSQSDKTAQHFRRYNKSMIEQLLSDRFEILYFNYFFSVLTIPIFVFRSLPFRLIGARSKNVLSKDTEHGSKKGIGVKVLNWLLKNELKKIEQGKKTHVGASCLFVARKLD